VRYTIKEVPISWINRKADMGTLPSGWCGLVVVIGGFFIAWWEAPVYCGNKYIVSLFFIRLGPFLLAVQRSLIVVLDIPVSAENVGRTFYAR
jgi:hypothetical protein